jgi:uncharacterized protein (DUF2267 family)
LLGPDKAITRGVIEAALTNRPGVDRDRATQILLAVGSTIAASVSPGQMQDVLGQMPEALRPIFSPARRAAR